MQRISTRTLPNVAAVKSSLVVLALLLACSCSRGLSNDEAVRTIAAHKAMTKADTVAVDGISLSTPNEAIVRATIDGETTNLKLRKYDTGWVWEFAETKAGGWIAAEEALTQLREPRRLLAAAEWARQHRAAYAATANDMHTLLKSAPNPKVGMDWAGWARIRMVYADMDKSNAALLRNEQPVDAWGMPFAAGINDVDNTLTLVSFGPDKTKSTDDDLIGVSKSRPVIENDGRMAYSHDLSWRLPESLGDVVEKATSPRPLGTIEYSKVVK